MLNTTPSRDNQIAPTGFDQINQQTWVQVANIMNVLAYFGQQTIVANSTQATISNQEQINGITYQVNADLVAANSTWAKWVNDNNKSSDVASSPMILRGMSEWVAKRNNFNYPINVYPAGSYGYSVTPTPSGDATAREGETILNYPAGLGTSVSANFKDSNGLPSTSVSLQQSGDANQSLTWNASSVVLLNGQVSSSNATDANVIFNNDVTTVGGVQIANQSTITITNGANGQPATRPQSVWYTVSASGTLGADASTQTTQQLYDLTQDETKNIFAITANKIPRATNGGVGQTGADGNSWTSPAVQAYTTAVGGQTSQGDGTDTATPVKLPDANGLTNDATSSTAISLSQNYLPLGITSDDKDAYFNNNGIIWNYHNGFVAGDTNPEISITGQVNAYIGGTIQGQESGADYLAEVSEIILSQPKMLS